MTLATLPAPNFTGADLSARVNAIALEARAARRFATVAALLADATLAYGAGARAVAAGDAVEAGGFRYEVAASAATMHHVATAGGVKLYVHLDSDAALHVSAFGAKFDGVTDDTVAIQSVIDAVIHKPYPATATGRTVKMPSGTAKISNTLHLGYGNSSYTWITFQGAGPRYDLANPAQGGTALVFTATDRQAINVQGARQTILRGFTLRGASTHIVNNGLGYAINDLDHLPATWEDPGLPAGAYSRFAPYAGITVDAFSGAAGANSYPAVAYPSFLGAVGQYSKNHSSDVDISDVNIERFAVGLCRPSTHDDNGEFIRFRRGSIKGCFTGIGFGHSQARNVAVQDANLGGCFWAINHGLYGNQRGRATGTYLNVHFGGCYNLIQAQGGRSDSLVLRNCYAEMVARIGEVAYTGQNKPLVLDGCAINFRERENERYWVPTSHVETGYLKVVLCNGTYIDTRHGLVVSGNSDGNNKLVVRDSTVVMLAGDLPVQFKEGTGGLLVFGVESVVGDNAMTIEDGKNHDPDSQFWVYKPYWMKEWRFDNPNGAMVGVAAAFAPPRTHSLRWEGLTVTLVNRSGTQVELPGGRLNYRPYGYAQIPLDLGDALRIGGAWFRVSGFNGANALLRQLTGYRMTDGGATFTNLTTSDGAAAQVQACICTRLFVPQLAGNGYLLGSATSGNAVVANVKDSYMDGNLWTVDGVAVGDMALLQEPELLNPGGNVLEHQPVLSALDRTAKTLAFTGNLAITKTGVRFPYWIKRFTA